MSLLKVAGTTASSGTLYVDDVFSTYLYTGTSNGATGAQTITNNIDLAGKGGLVWIKNRTTAYVHNLQDTVRGAGNRLRSDSTSAQNYNAEYITSFNSNGFSIGLDAGINQNTDAICSWTFREAAKFFDVVTWTGTNSPSSRLISHSLGSQPGHIMMKRTDAAGDWSNWNIDGAVYREFTPGINSTASLNSSRTATNVATSTSIDVWYTQQTSGIGDASGATYVAYLFAHDTSADGIIQCGSFTTDGSGNATVNLGWEPQYIMAKRSDSTGYWIVLDTMRGWVNGGSITATDDKSLFPNVSDAETNDARGYPTATGFTFAGSASGNYIYMAIRRPNKPPTSGTQVFSPQIWTGTGSTQQITTGFFPDMFIGINRGAVHARTYATDILRGLNVTLATNITDPENSEAGNTFNMTGYSNNNGNLNSTFGGGQTYVGEFFKRAPGFFDEVCYSGTAVNRTVAHNLTVVPEMMIIKCRTMGYNWIVYTKPVGATAALFLQSTSEAYVYNEYFNNTEPTSSVFTVGIQPTVNESTKPYVAYLFATLAGISKVGSYTGNGTGQAIACGFSAGARFVLIKRTDAAEAWYTFDSARGLTVGSSPYLLLNSTAAEVTGNNGVYASTGGFTLATSVAGLNASGGTYIFLAVA